MENIQQKIMTKKKIILIILIIPFFVFLFISASFIWTKIYISQPIPFYQKVKLLDYLDVCKKIQSSELQNLCLLTVNNNDYKIDFREINPKCGESGVCFYKIWGNLRGERYIERYLSDPEAKTDPNYCDKEGRANMDYCRAILKNPYYCRKLYVPQWFVKFPFKPIEKSVWFSTTPEQCYHDSALFWKDTSLCQKVKNEDFCYLSLVVFNINIDKKMGR